MARRQHNLVVGVALVLVVFLTVSFLFSEPAKFPRRDASPSFNPLQGPLEATAPLKSAGKSGKDAASFSLDVGAIPAGILDGDSVAPKLENATLKAELGRATWHFLHTMVARFPEKPTTSDRQTLETFIQLFGRLYPCGDCARHFRGILAEYPPQTSSRNAAAGWLCFAHNQVNKRLDKPLFDCTKIGDFYDCGCGDDDKKE